MAHVALAVIALGTPYLAEAPSRSFTGDTLAL